jgi:hypothetical protein
MYFPHLGFTAYIKKIILAYCVFSHKIFNSKHRNRLISVEDELRVSLSKVRPRIKYLCSKEQANVSH